MGCRSGLSKVRKRTRLFSTSYAAASTDLRPWKGLLQQRISTLSSPESCPPNRKSLQTPHPNVHWIERSFFPPTQIFETRTTSVRNSDLLILSHLSIANQCYQPTMNCAMKLRLAKVTLHSWRPLYPAPINISNPKFIQNLPQFNLPCCLL